MKISLPILQSGFLSRSEKGLVQVPQPDEEKIIRAIELGKPFDSNGKPFFYDGEVEQLFNEYRADNRKLKNFEFRENFLRAAKNAFSCNRLSDWVYLQEEKSPYFSQMHRRFIEDTINFINNGKREIDVESWLGLIYPRLKLQSDMGLSFDKKVTWFLDEVNPSMGLVVSIWTSQVGGWNDFIMTVGTIFSTSTGRSV